jgi:carbamoyl-phosphate synthase large subunit
LNIQFLVKGDSIWVIECNARASRSFPFVSKVVGYNLAKISTQVMIADPEKAKIQVNQNTRKLPHVGVKAAMFSFHRLAGADPVLGVEMASTGEVGCLGQTWQEALLLAFQATGIQTPKKGILLSAGRPEQKSLFIPALGKLKKLGIPVYATPGTAQFFKEQGFSEVIPLNWPNQSNNVLEAIQSGQIDWVINLPKNYTQRELENGYEIRKTAIQFGCVLLTNLEKAEAYLTSLTDIPRDTIQPKCQN